MFSKPKKFLKKNFEDRKLQWCYNGGQKSLGQLLNPRGGGDSNTKKPGGDARREF